MLEPCKLELNILNLNNAIETESIRCSWYVLHASNVIRFRSLNKPVDCCYSARRVVRQNNEQNVLQKISKDRYGVWDYV